MPDLRDHASDIGERKLSTLRGVGPALELALSRLGIERVQDLWFHLPLRYEDRTRLTPIRELVPGAPAQVEGVVAACERSFRFRPQLRLAITDASAGTLLLRFFHFRTAQAEQLAPGTRLRVLRRRARRAAGPGDGASQLPAHRWRGGCPTRPCRRSIR